MPQKTRSRTKNDTSTTSYDSTSRTSEPPSFSELTKKAKRNYNLGSFSSKTLGYIAGILTLGFGTSLIPFLAFSIPGGWITTVFVVSLIGSLISDGDYLESGIAGGAIVGLMALLSGAIFTFAIYAGFGVMMGIAGTMIGKKLQD